MSDDRGQARLPLVLLVRGRRHDLVAYLTRPPARRSGAGAGTLPCGSDSDGCTV